MSITQNTGGENIMPFSDYYLWAGIALIVLEFLHFQRQRKLGDRRTKLFYGMLGISLIICVAGILLTTWISNKMAGELQARIMIHIVYLAQFCLPLMLLRMVCLTAHIPDTLFFKYEAVVWGACSMVILMNPWTRWISYMGTDGRLHVGTFYPFLVWGMVAFYLADMVFLWSKRKMMKQRQAAALAEAISIMIIGILLQNVLRLFLVVGFTAALMMIVLYLTMQNPYAYVDFVTQVLNADYYRYWIEEKFKNKEDVFMLCLKLTDLERIRMENGTDQEMSKAVAEKLWNITPGHAVFRVRYDTYILFTKNKEEHRKLLERIKKLFSIEIAINGHLKRCPVVVAEMEHAERVCHGNYNEVMNYFRFLLQQVEEKQGFQCIECSDELQKKYKYERNVEQYIRFALDYNLFEVWYQLVYSLSEKRFVSMEALSRLYHPKLGWISPELFIRLSMKNDWIFELMKHQLHKICRFLKENEEVLAGINNVKINISPKELTRKRYCENLIAIIRSNGLSPERFQFEITETCAANYSKELEDCILMLENAGITLCLDDFGCGYANLERILHLPFSVIKMDRSLLHNIGINPRTTIFYESMVKTLHHCGYQIVSEGVETRREVEVLENCKVDMIQGYYYAKPLPGHEILEKLRKS